MNTYTEEERKVLAKLVVSGDRTHHPVFYAEEIALRLSNQDTHNFLPAFVENFVSQCPYQDVPKFMRYPELKTLIEWRLTIGK